MGSDEEATAHNLENLLQLPTRWGDTITPGSSAKLADGAAACVLMNETGLKRCLTKCIATKIKYMYFSYSNTPVMHDNKHFILDII